MARAESSVSSPKCTFTRPSFSHLKETLYSPTIIIDEKNPRNIPLCACYKRMFVYWSMTTRTPNMIKDIILDLVQDRGTIIHKYGTAAKNEISEIITRLTDLKCDVELDKQFQKFEIWSPDQEIWNASIDELNNRNTYFSSSWIYAECYVFRRIREIFHEQSILRHYDYFEKHKENALLTQFAPMKAVSKFIDQNRSSLLKDPTKLENFFYHLIKMDLWSNQLDLSLLDGKQANEVHDPIAAVARYDSSILVNDNVKIWKCLLDRGNEIIDIICDNAGYELFMDLCLGDFLLENSLAKQIRYHVKVVPFFVSDTLSTDFLWTLRMLRTHTDEYISKIGNRCCDYMADGRFRLMDKEHFWTTGYGYSRMKELDFILYQTLCIPHLIIFKGDMNYRKLLDEINWEPTTSFEDALQGFRPSNLCVMRTIKAEVVCGLSVGVAERIEETELDWMVSGKYGLIQFAGKINL